MTIILISTLNHTYLYLMQLYQDGINEEGAGDMAESIGVLDLAEVAVQTLLQEVSGVSFLVSETKSGRASREGLNEEQPLIDSSAMDSKYGTAPAKLIAETERAMRPSYYNILDMGDRDMKTSYLLRNTEVLREQLEEDKRVETFWKSRFANLIRD